MKQLVCPHFGTISGLQWWCLNGKFPVDCEHCDCEDKYWVEITTTTNATLK
jgi:hypothetical protein